MENHTSDPHGTPPDSFRLEELELLQSFENQLLVDVNYYLWLNHADPGDIPYRFLFYLELIFDNNLSLLLTSGDDSEAIRVSDAEALVKTAEELRALHGRVIIQRVNAGRFPLWEPAVGTVLESIRLSKNEEGLYYNDALVFDFGAHQVLLQLSAKEGLELTVFN